MNLLPPTILVLGGGGREHTMALKFAECPEVRSVVCASGARDWIGLNCVDTMGAKDFQIWATRNPNSLVLVGPESYVVGGIADDCAVPVLAPSKHVAQLESSKIFCKQVCQSAGVLTPHSQTLNWTQIQAYLNEPFLMPSVVKYDGLAAGKGVVVLNCDGDRLDAIELFDKNLSKWTADNGNKQPMFLVEDMVRGDEVSVTALCNGREFKILPHCRDYKRRNNGQTGPNTGGMGAACPVTFSATLDAQFQEAITKILNYMADAGTPYRGFLFAGFMIDPATQLAWLLEINCRLGEPETQVLFPGLGRDFATECFRTARGLPFLNADPLRHDGLKRVFVVHTSPEYPEPTTDRLSVKNWNQLRHEAFLVSGNVEPDGGTLGGRMFGYLGVGDTFGEARTNAFQHPPVKLLGKGGIEAFSYLRSDIAADLL